MSLAWGAPQGKRLRLLREESGRTLGDMARKTGLSAATLSAWERATAAPTLSHLTTLSASLGVTGWFLLCQDKPGATQPELRSVIGPADQGQPFCAHGWDHVLIRGSLPWHYCPVCGYEDPARRGHAEGCDGVGLEVVP